MKVMSQKGFVDPFSIIPLLMSAAIGTLIYIFIAQPYVMSGDSMKPALKNGEYFLVNKMDKDFKEGDIVVFKNPDNPNYDVVKRIQNPPEEINLKEDEYYVLGDNKEKSIDSRNFGSINKSSIIGKYWFSYYKQ